MWRRENQIKIIFLRWWSHTELSKNIKQIQEEWPLYVDIVIRFIIAILIPTVQMIAVAGAVLLLSIILFWYLRTISLPKTILDEVVHFDYSRSEPQAIIVLPAIKKQWTYADSTTHPDPAVAALANQTVAAPRKTKHYLYGGSTYSIELQFALAKSKRNFDAANCPLQITTFDAYDNLIAMSSRALTIPFQSQTSLYWEALYFLPWRLAGSMPIEEVVHVKIKALSDYVEPSLQSHATHGIRITMGSPSMDIQSTSITILPKLTGLKYFLYHYPIVSFVLGVGVLFVFQMCMLFGIFVCALCIRYIYSMVRSLDQRPPRTMRSSSANSGSFHSDIDMRYQRQPMIQRLPMQQRSDIEHVPIAVLSTDADAGRGNVAARTGSDEMVAVVSPTSIDLTATTREICEGRRHRSPMQHKVDEKSNNSCRSISSSDSDSSEGLDSEAYFSVQESTVLNSNATIKETRNRNDTSTGASAFVKTSIDPSDDSESSSSSSEDIYEIVWDENESRTSYLFHIFSLIFGKQKMD